MAIQIGDLVKTSMGLGRVTALPNPKDWAPMYEIQLLPSRTIVEYAPEYVTPVEGAWSVGDLTIPEVEAAITDELDAIRMYGSWAERLSEPRLKEAFRNIANQELHHKEALEDLLSMMRGR